MGEFFNSPSFGTFSLVFLATAAVAQTQPDPCSPLSEKGIACEAVAVDVFSMVREGGVLFRSEPIAMRHGAHAIGCCINGAPPEQFALVAVTDPSTDLTEMGEGCLAGVLGSIAAIESAVRDPDAVPETTTFRLSEGENTQTVLELRAHGDGPPTTALCEVVADTGGGEPAARGFVLFFDDGADK